MKLQNRLAAAILVLGLCLVFSSQLALLGQNLLTTIQPVTPSGTFAVTANAGTNLNTSALALDASLTTLDTDVKSNVTLHAGTNLVGKVGIDQTTPGTTNGVQDAATSATGAAPPSKAIFIAGLGSGATGGFLIGATVGDTPKVINVSTATTTLMITGVASRQVHIAHYEMLTAGANNVAWIEGTGATCGTGSAGIAGGTTAASGYNFAANGGISAGTGIGDVLRTSTAGDSVCLVTSAAVQLSGFINYAIY